MNPTLEKKIQKFKAVMQLKAKYDELHADDDDPMGCFDPPSSIDFLRSSLDYLNESDATDIIAMMAGDRAGHSANSIGVEEIPAAAQVEKPRAVPNAKTAPVEEQGYTQQFGRAKRPAQDVDAQPPGGTPWITWSDSGDDGEPPVDVDDAIAYRMKNGEVLMTDYPHALNWCREGESSDIVEYRLLTVDEVKSMTPWVEWSGGECPVDPALKVQTRLFCYGRNDTCVAGLEQWQHNPKGHRNYDANIVAYRVVTA